VQFEIGDEVGEFMAATGLREDAVRYAAERPTSEQVQEYEDEDVIVVFCHDPNNKRLRLVFTRDRTRLLQVRPVQ
jgi:hypothetical protein